MSAALATVSCKEMLELPGDVGRVLSSCFLNACMINDAAAVGATPQVRGWVGSGGMLGRRTSYFTHSEKSRSSVLNRGLHDYCVASDAG